MALLGVFQQGRGASGKKVTSGAEALFLAARSAPLKPCLPQNELVRQDRMIELPSRSSDLNGPTRTKNH